MILLVIAIPIIAGALISLIPFKERRHMEVFLETWIVLNSLLVLYLLVHRPDHVVTLANFTGNLSIGFKVDGMSMVFAGLVSALWPFATLYAFEYMTKEEHEKIFFTFFTMTYGVTLGIALSANLLTMYFFYELLTLVTVPLVMHTLTREAILASRKYLYYSLGGAAFAFIGLIFIIIYGSTTDFVLGGVLDLEKVGD
ncbi:MAG: proton-conducting membrane transporter, partial [Lachnospiraceae bacterium]|nr:proton-conducting membrane transporter [Lachnospiraceae bacterium]